MAVVAGKTGEGGRSVCNLEAAKGAAEVRENVTVFGGDRADMRRVCGFGGEGHEVSPRSICVLPSSTSLVFYAFVGEYRSPIELFPYDTTDDG
jgi:hypothetical protein